MRQSVTPSGLRAAVKCDMPRRSSTRTNSSVSPEGKPDCTRVENRVRAYGQSLA